MNRGARRTMLLIGALLLALAGLTLASRALERDQKSWDDPSVHNTHNRGLAFLFQALKETGTPVREMRSPFSFLHDDDGLLIFGSPSKTAMTRRDTEALDAWVKRGHLVMYLMEMESYNPLDLEWRRSLGLSSLAFQEEPRWHKWLKGVALTVYCPHTLAEGVTRLNMVGGGQFRLSYPPAVGVPLAGDENRARVVLMPRGKGAVVVADHGSLLNNRGILKGDNLRFLMNMAVWAGKEKPIVFAEYYHHQDFGRTLMGMLKDEGLLLPLLQLVVALLLLMAAFMPRFGDPVPVPGPVVRGTPGYFESLARLSLDRATPETRALVMGRLDMLRHRVTEGMGLAPAPLERFLRRLSRQPGVSDLVTPLMETHDKLNNSVMFTPEDLLTVSRLCFELEQRLLLHGRSNGGQS